MGRPRVGHFVEMAAANQPQGTLAQILAKWFGNGRKLHKIVYAAEGIVELEGQPNRPIPIGDVVPHPDRRENVWGGAIHAVQRLANFHYTCAREALWRSRT